MRNIEFAEDFLRDVQAHVDWLSRHREPNWIDGLERGLEEAEQRVLQFPDSGRILRQDGSVTLRKLILRRLPYFVWYAYDSADADGTVWMLRLFHTRQQQQAPGPQHPLRRRPR